MPFRLINPQITRDIPTSLSSITVKERIDAHINNFPNQDSLAREPIFTGLCFGYTFELQRPRKVFSYSTRYSPLIQGEITEQQTNTVVRLVFSPSAQGQINFLFPILFAIGSTILIILSLQQGVSALIALVFAYLFAGTQYSVYYTMYKREVDKDTETIVTILGEDQDRHNNSETYQAP